MKRWIALLPLIALFWAHTAWAGSVFSGGQFASAELSAIANLVCTDDKVLYRTGGTWTCVNEITNVTVDNFTANRAIVSNGDGELVPSSATATEVGYLSGLTGNAQAKFDSLDTTIAGLSTGGATASVTTFSTAQSPAGSALNGLKTYVQTGGSAVAFTLPTAASGLAFDLETIAGGTAVKPASASDVITIDGSALTAGHYASCASNFSRVFSTGTNAWRIRTLQGSACTDGGATFTSLAASPSTWDPADGVNGDTAATQQITFTASGAVTFSALALVTTGQGFTLPGGETGTPCTSSIALGDGESCNVKVSFAYATGGPYSDTLRITHNGTNSPVNVALGPTTVVAAGGASWTDNFNRANQNPLVDGKDASATPTGTWATVTGRNALRINSSQVDGSGENSAGRATASLAANQYAQITFRGYSGATYGPLVRVASDANTYYQASFASASAVRFYKLVAGSWSQLGTDCTSDTFVSGDTLRLEASGTGATVTLTAKRNGSAFSVACTATDSAADRILSGSAGLWFGNINMNPGDDFECGDL